ncbi:MAG: CHC2 zinc finger domain-containing protein [Actinomycetota bacterium]|nr:CHC2 zinc finger domain-containing protein [Actinomycetota bacterium]
MPTKTTAPSSARSGARKVGDIFADPDAGYLFKKALEAVKAAVRIEQVAAEYGEFKLLGRGRLLGRCVAPDHEDRTPSLTIFTEEGRFKCFGCGLFGDAVDLERVAGRHLEAWTAVQALAERYGVELPKRSQRWHEWSTEKGRRYDELRRWRERRYHRRYYRMFAADGIAEIEDADERAREAAKAWDELGGLARAWAIRSMEGTG